MDSELFLKWLHHFIKYAPEEKTTSFNHGPTRDTRLKRRDHVLQRKHSGNSLPTCTHHAHSSAPGYCGFQPAEDCFLHHGFQDGSGARGHCCGEEAVSALLKHVYPTAVTRKKHQGWVPQSRHLSSVQGCCGHNSGNFDINTMIIHPLSYLHYFSSVLMSFTYVLFLRW